MAKNNFDVDGKKYCMLIDGDQWRVTDAFGNDPLVPDTEHPDFHKTVIDKFNELKTAGYLLWQYIDPRQQKKT